MNLYKVQFTTKSGDFLCFSGPVFIFVISLAVLVAGALHYTGNGL